MTGKRKYTISFSGLSVGQHEYEYNLADSFFEGLEYSEIKKGTVRVDIRLNKQHSMLILDFIVRGEVMTVCDRCSDDCKLKINGTYQLSVKLGKSDDEIGDEDLLVLAANEGELDVAHHLYEYTILSLPAKRIHQKIEDCNKEVIKKLKEIELADQNQSNDPRWDKLKTIKFNN